MLLQFRRALLWTTEKWDEPFVKQASKSESRTCSLWVKSPSIGCHPYFQPVQQDSLLISLEIKTSITSRLRLFSSRINTPLILMKRTQQLWMSCNWNRSRSKWNQVMDKEINASRNECTKKFMDTEWNWNEVKLKWNEIEIKSNEINWNKHIVHSRYGIKPNAPIKLCSVSPIGGGVTTGLE